MTVFPYGGMTETSCVRMATLTSRPYFILFALPGAFVWVYNMSSGGASEKAAIAETRGRNGTKCNKCSWGHPQPEYNENLMSKKMVQVEARIHQHPSYANLHHPSKTNMHDWQSKKTRYFSPTPVLDDKTEWMHIQSNQANHLATHVRYYHWPIFTLQQNISGRCWCWCIIDPLKNLVKALS